MNYKDLYRKHKLEYLLLKSLEQKGGYINHKYDDLKFLDNWDEIKNSGQQNCGIFINKNKPKKIIKCTKSSHKLDDADKINKESKTNIFPEIYQIYTIDKNQYIEMEKFDGDVTDLLLHKSINIILKQININDQQRSDIKFLYNAMTPYTTLPQGPNFWMYNFTYLPNDSTIQETIKSENFIDLANRLKNSTITSNMYDLFFNHLQDFLTKIIPEVTKQIFMLRYSLIKLGFEYNDNKYDNYAYDLLDYKKNYLEINWSNNKFNNINFYIHIIDWDSGLFKIEQDEEEIKWSQDKLIRYFNNTELFSIHGQYSLRTINKKLVTSDSPLKSHFLPEIFKIISKDYGFDDNQLPKFSFKSLDEIKEYIVKSED
jgi:hypothetical protein